MTQANEKNFSEKVKRSEYDIEEDFQDTSLPNAKPSEPSRNKTMSQPSSNKDQIVKKAGEVSKT